MTQKKKRRAMIEETEKKQASHHPSGSIAPDAGHGHTVSPDHDVEEIHVKSFFSVSDRKIRYFM